MVNVSEVPAKILRIALTILSQLCPYSVRILVWFSKSKNLKTKKVQKSDKRSLLVKGYHHQGNVFTLDALHCQKETTTLIAESKNDYVIALKCNQKNLFKQVVNIIENQPPKSQAESVDISHGRHLVRKVSVFDIPPQKLKDFERLKWGNITSLIKVERSGTRGKKDYEHLTYYILLLIGISRNICVKNSRSLAD